MFMIRKPIPRSVSIGLGIASILALISCYGWLANGRASIKRQEARQQLEKTNADLGSLRSQLASNPNDAELSKRVDRLETQASNLQSEVVSAVDRSMPTYGSLYRDGLLRVL
ncbi:MAG: hypothetical protein KDB27_00065, partial [Planctomycetales bacterium]|nr:hypothetical protein [Planctomycetales bacterium]